MPKNLTYQGLRAGSPLRHKILAFAPGRDGDEWMSETAANGQALTEATGDFDRQAKKHKSLTFAIPATTRVPTYTKGDDLKDFTIEIWDPTLRQSKPWRQIVVRPAKVVDVKEVDVPKPTPTFPGKYREVVLSFTNGPYFL